MSDFDFWFFSMVGLILVAWAIGAGPLMTTARTEAFFERADAAVRGWLFRRTKSDQAFALAEALDDARRWEATYDQEARERNEVEARLVAAERKLASCAQERDALWRQSEHARQRWATSLEAAIRQRDRHALVAGICAGLFVTAIAALAILLLGPFGLH